MLMMMALKAYPDCQSQRAVQVVTAEPVKHEAILGEESGELGCESK